MNGRITAFYSVKSIDFLWIKKFQCIGKVIFFQTKLIINILVFCHWVLSKINTNSEEILNKFSMIFF